MTTEAQRPRSKDRHGYGEPVAPEARRPAHMYCAVCGVDLGTASQPHSRVTRQVGPRVFVDLCFECAYGEATIATTQAQRVQTKAGKGKG